MKEERFTKRLQKEMTVCRRFLYNQNEAQHRAVSESPNLHLWPKEQQSLKMFKGNTL
jgi:hypothetical protein